MKKLSNVVIFLLFSCLLFCSAELYALQPKVSDASITGKIKANIAKDPALSAFKVNVRTKKGIVYLSGVVNSDTDASAFIELAEATSGVRDVESTELKIKDSQQPFTDTAITAKVKGTFIREKLFGKEVSPMISVETNNGVVYLSGNVNNQREVKNAIALAKTVNGVKRVESRLKIKSK